nr:hypothetical protein Iba_chr04bCG16210 [Ipomoea batatas]
MGRFDNELSLDRNNGKGIVIHEKPAGLQSNKVSSGKLSVEGKGKGILIEENVHMEQGLSEREDSASQQEGAVEDALFYTLCNAEVRMFLYLLRLQELGAVAKMEAESMSGAVERPHVTKYRGVVFAQQHHERSSRGFIKHKLV